MGSGTSSKLSFIKNISFIDYNHCVLDFNNLDSCFKLLSKRIYEPTKKMFSNALSLLSSIRLVYDNGNTMRLAKRRKNALLRTPFKKPK